MISFLSKVIVIKNQVVKNKNLSFIYTYIYIYINSLFCFNLSLSRQELYSLINTFNRDIQVLNSPLLPFNQITQACARVRTHTHTHIYIYIYITKSFVVALLCLIWEDPLMLGYLRPVWYVCLKNSFQFFWK